MALIRFWFFLPQKFTNRDFQRFSIIFILLTCKSLLIIHNQLNCIAWRQKRLKDVLKVLKSNNNNFSPQSHLRRLKLIRIIAFHSFCVLDGSHQTVMWPHATHLFVSILKWCRSSHIIFHSVERLARVPKQFVVKSEKIAMNANWYDWSSNRGGSNGTMGAS